MRNITLTSRLKILIVFLFSIFSLHSQVTIGSGVEPNKGALLDLKENNGGAENISTNKGFILPRVKLTDMNNLYPMLRSDNNGNYKEGAKNEQDKFHTGLAVYHIGECSMDGMGLYLWNGNRWKKLAEELPAYVYKIVDSRDGEEYLVRNFGSDAGDWMLENIRYLDNDITISRVTDLQFSDAQRNSIQRYFYPNGKDDAPPPTWRKKQGLLYTYAAATKGIQNNINQEQGQIPGSIPGNYEVEKVRGYIQGICPIGWHIPSDREWNTLEKEIYNNPEKYSEYISNNVFVPSSWDPSWESGKSNSSTIFRGSTNDNGLGYAMLSQCPANNNGKSYQYQWGGFDALLVGYRENPFVGEYGEACFFWTASSGTSINDFNPDLFWAWTRMIVKGNKNPQRLLQTRSTMFSVRCKKD